MRKISKEELDEILEKHKKWVNSKNDGEKADLRGADLQCIDLRCADLHCADLRGADLHCADLRGTDLRGTDLRDTNLCGAILQFADLTNATLSGTILNGADLGEADLRFANLQYANLNHVNLQGAKLSHANLKYAERPWLVYAGNIGSRKAETLYFADCDNVRCGCWSNYKGGTLTEFKARIDEIYPSDSENEAYQKYRAEYISAIKMFESMREAYLDEISL